MRLISQIKSLTLSSVECQGSVVAGMWRWQAASQGFCFSFFSMMGDEWEVLGWRGRAEAGFCDDNEAAGVT